MKQNFLNKKKMYDTVKAICSEYQTAWSGIPAFSNAFSAFSTKVNELAQLSLVQTQQITGIATDKTKLRKLAVNQAIVIIGALKAFASGENNNELLNHVNFSRSKLVYGSNAACVNKLLVVHAKALEFEPELVDFGIDSQKITDLDSALIVFQEALTAPRVAILQRKFYTDRISKTIKEIDDVLNHQLDELTIVLMNTAPEFFSKYTISRIIVDAKGKRRNDSIDGFPQADIEGPPGEL